MAKKSVNPLWTPAIVIAVVSIGVLLALYVHKNTSVIRDALAKEVLEQQSDVTNLLHKYANIALSIERLNSDGHGLQNQNLIEVVKEGLVHLQFMRQNYSFERLDGAAKAHAFAKPILEDVQQWIASGVPGYTLMPALALDMASRRINDRYPMLKQIADETDSAAKALIAQQSGDIKRFSDSLILLLAAYGLVALAIVGLLVRQRNLQFRLAANQERQSQRFRDFADVGADLFWETDEALRLTKLSEGEMHTVNANANTNANTNTNTNAWQETDAKAASAGQSNPLHVVHESLDIMQHLPIQVLNDRRQFNDYESEIVTPENDRLIVSISGKPVHDNKGRFLGYRGVGKDVTERKRMEAELELANRALIAAETTGREKAEYALRGSEAFLRETLDALPVNIVIINELGNIIAVNTAWRRLFSAGGIAIENGGIGSSYPQVCAQVFSEYKVQEAVRLADLREPFDGTQRLEFVRTLDDQQRWYVISRTIFDSNRSRFAAIVHEDVTDRKLLEAKDTHLRSELAHIARVTTAGEMASGLAHELNQPLTAISHNCDALLSYKEDKHQPDGEFVDTVNDIYDQTQRAGGIIRSIRQLVRKDPVDASSVDFNALVQETVRLTQSYAQQHEVSVELDLADDLVNPSIDPVQFQQVLVNLERNGVEAISTNNSKNRKLSISTRMSDPETIQVTVEDTGPGFDPAIKGRLFTAFQTTKEDGMGLGLSISRSIVESQGGRLWVDSTTSDVTRFHFTIPVKKR